jgi:uncharacterized protein (TIGR03083 family)
MSQQNGSCQTRDMEPAAYLNTVKPNGDLLAAAAEQGPAERVPTCPDWDLTGLVAHVGTVHHWVNHIVGTRASGPSAADDYGPPSLEFDAVMAWYRAGLDAVVATLRATDPDELVWNWFDRAPAPARFWYRRMALETSVHRWDGENAVGDAHPLAADLAVNGLDEFLGFVALWLPRRPVPGLEGTLHLHATDTATDTDTDTEGEWALTLHPDAIEHHHQHVKGDAAIRGAASDLLLWAVNRKAPDSGGLELFGNRALVDAWGTMHF